MDYAILCVSSFVSLTKELFGKQKIVYHILNNASLPKVYYTLAVELDKCTQSINLFLNIHPTIGVFNQSLFNVPIQSSGCFMYIQRVPDSLV